jgi:hypothetical protein
MLALIEKCDRLALDLFLPSEKGWGLFAISISNKAKRRRID